MKACQAQLEADLVHAWGNDPIAQAEMLRGDTAKFAPVLQMPATYQRHEKSEAPN